MDTSHLLSLLTYERLTEVAVFAGIVLASAIIARIVYWVAEHYVRRITHRTRTTLDDRLLSASEPPVNWGIILIGFYIGFYYLFDGSAYASLMGLGISVAATIWLMFAAISMGGALFDWYAAEGPGAKSRGLSEIIPTLKRIFYAFVVALGLIMLLGKLGIEVSPLLASLGIAGLAVALAFQDTLANFFAGIYIGVDRPVKPGDYIKLDSGQEGYVDKIGWRNTQVRMLANNMIVVPNSKLAQAIVTNYYSPSKDMAVVVPCSVSYDSDLEKVERVVCEVAEGAQKRVKGAVSDFKPFIRYNEFGESGIAFSVILRTQEFVGQYELKHEFIKALHKRFRKEGIEIPYPKRDVYMRRERSRGG